MVLRDEEGQPIFTACRSLVECGSPPEAELRACTEGLELALRYSPLPTIIETDCSLIIEATSFSTRDRSQVRVSHCLASLAKAEHRTDMWLGSGPDDILHVLEHDRFVTRPV